MATFDDGQAALEFCKKDGFEPHTNSMSSHGYRTLVCGKHGVRGSRQKDDTGCIGGDGLLMKISKDCGKVRSRVVLIRRHLGRLLLTSLSRLSLLLTMHTVEWQFVVVTNISEHSGPDLVCKGP